MSAIADHPSRRMRRRPRRRRPLRRATRRCSACRCSSSARSRSASRSWATFRPPQPAAPCRSSSRRPGWACSCPPSGRQRSDRRIVACIFGLFAGFWWSYSVLVLGLNHNWFAIPAADVTDSVALFQISWAIVMGVLTLATLRLPVAFTAVVGLVVVALVLLVFGTTGADADAHEGGRLRDVHVRRDRDLPVPRRRVSRRGRQGLPARPADRALIAAGTARRRATEPSSGAARASARPPGCGAGRCSPAPRAAAATRAGRSRPRTSAPTPTARRRRRT